MTDLEYLEQYCDELTPREFYRLIFPEGELEKKGEYIAGMYTGIALSVDTKRQVRRYTVTDDLNVIDELIQTDRFTIMSPISYAGKNRTSDNARYLYALAIDLDGLKQEQSDGEPLGISTLFWQFDGHGDSNYLPLPTAIVASGTGLHLYYVFEHPIPLYRDIVKRLEKFKRRLTWQLWTQGVSNLQDAVQYESLFQGFRMPGTITKQGQRTRAFLVDYGKRVSMEYLNSFVPDNYRTGDLAYKRGMTLQEAKERYPEWYERRIVRKQPKGRWRVSRAVYDWWKKQIYDFATDGHRYYCVMALAIYAIKCGVDREELEKDALGMVDMLNSRGTRADNPFTVEDVMTALEAYNESYITYTVESMAFRTGIEIKRNKRNYRKQADHIKVMNTMKLLKKQLGEDMKEGRPTKEDIVKKWRRRHPNGKKADCIRDTGISRPTVDKWWGAATESGSKELGAAQRRLLTENVKL